MVKAVAPSSVMILSPGAASAGVGEKVELNTDGTSEMHNQEQIAVNPLDGDEVVAVWRDFRLGDRRVGVGVSHDGGLTWIDGLLPDVDSPRASDPGICADADGNLHGHTLALSSGQALAGVAIQVFKPTDRGDTWGGAGCP